MMKTYEILRMNAQRHISKAGDDGVLIGLIRRDGGKPFSLWLCFDNSAGGQKATASLRWKQLRGKLPIPNCSLAAYERRGELQCPLSVTYSRNRIIRVSL